MDFTRDQRAKSLRHALMPSQVPRAETPAAGSHTIAPVTRLRPVGLVLAMTVGWLPVAPPEHVHEDADHGHQHVVVHRHAAAHHALLDPTHHEDTHDGVFDDQDPVLTLDAVYGLPVSPAAIDRPMATASVLIEPPAVAILERPRESVERLNTGPPLAPTSLRAPPSISRL